jgi:hypothetical protein
LLLLAILLTGLALSFGSQATEKTDVRAVAQAQRPLRLRGIKAEYGFAVVTVLFAILAAWLVSQMMRGHPLATAVATVFSALLTPAIALLAGYIAWQQWHTARNKLKLELFERRYVVYSAAIGLINSVLASGKADRQALFEFVSKTRSARFVVGQRIEKYLNDELYRRVVHLETLEAERSGLSDGDLVRNVQEQSSIKTWLVDQYNVLMSLFADQLTLEH